MTKRDTQIDQRPSLQEENKRSLMQTAQLRSIAMLAPVMILSNFIMLLYFQWLYAGVGSSSAKSAWSFALLSILFLHVLNWWKSGKQPKTRGLQKTSKRFGKSAVYKMHFLAFCHGSIWAASAILFYDSGPNSLQASLAVAYITMLVFGGAWLAPLPGATLMFVTPMLLGGAYVFVSQPISKPSISVMAILCGVAIITPIVSSVYTKLLNAFFISLKKLKRQRYAVASLFKELEENSSDWVWETDPKGYLVRFPEKMTPPGIDPKTIRLIDYIQRVVVVKGTQLEELENAFSAQKEFKDLLLCLQINHQENWIRLSGHPVYDEGGNLTGYLGAGNDVTLEKRAEDRIAVLSQNDSLTGLMNRGAFSKCLEAAAVNLDKFGRPFSVLYLDLDSFKLINDTKGHLYGDRLLIEVSNRIKADVGQDDIIARLGGDEFAILLDDKGDQGAAARLASKLVGEVAKPYTIDGQIFKVGVSIGIALAPLNGRRAEQLLRNADLALYRAKADGRGVFRFFENSMDAEMRKKRMLEAELRNAVVNDEMILHFQPLIDASTGIVRGMEALIRWQHPIRGLLPPAEFIELAESTHLISDVGSWTLHKACETAVRWPDNIYVSVNVSAHHFMAAEFLEEVRSALTISGLDPARLELELTESLLIDKAEDVIKKLSEIKKLGVTVSMDDFGTGYSSLSYLMNVPFDKLKIDKSFVDQIVVHDTGKKIVRMICKLAQELSLDVTAEGVETHDQAQFLRAIGCNTLQGFHFSKPMPEDEIPVFLLKNNSSVIRPEISRSIAS